MPWTRVRPRARSTSASPFRPPGTAAPSQLGGGGFNGVVPNLTGGAGPGSPSLLARGMVTYGSDSGHQAAFGPPGRRGGGAREGGPAAPRVTSDDWTLNEEAIANLGYMQMKKTHDAAMVLVERLYGERPRFNYFIGSSQGGREALTVAERYPADYDGIAANVPIVGFSTLMLAPELIRIQEKPLANWITPAKVNAIRGEFMRQCDTLDGLADGIINHYMACRAIFDVSQGARGRRPWAAKRCPDNVDPDPADTSASACLTDGQISTLELTYSRYAFATPLAHGVRTFGMWVPNTDPVGQRAHRERALQGTGRGPGDGREAFASRCARRHRVPDAGSVGQPARLRRRRRVQRAAGRALPRARFHEPGSQRLRQTGRQDDRHDRDQRHARVPWRAARLLPGDPGHDGTRDGRSRSPVCS